MIIKLIILSVILLIIIYVAGKLVQNWIEKEKEEAVNETLKAVGKNNETKEKMETGNSGADFDASIDILRKLKK